MGSPQISLVLSLLRAPTSTGPMESELELQ